MKDASAYVREGPQSDESLLHRGRESGAYAPIDGKKFHEALFRPPGLVYCWLVPVIPAVLEALKENRRLLRARREVDVVA